jgi:hypothetical protein
MHLVYKALEGEALPDVLPLALIPPSKRSGSMSETKAAPPMAEVHAHPAPMQEVKPAMAPMQEVKPAAMPVAETKPMMEDKPMMEAKPMMAAPATETSNWVVTAAEKTGFDTYFNGADADHDGYVTGCRAAFLGGCV